jgi:hypothetical protein
MWIDSYVDGGLTQFRDEYLQREVYSDPLDALIELEERYGLDRGALTEGFDRRLNLLAEEGRRQAAESFEFNAEMLDREQALRRIPDASKAGAFLLCLPESELLTALEGYAATKPPVHRRSGYPNLFAYLEHAFQVRGLPYTVSASEGIRWVGEPAIRNDAIEPALSVLTDPRLANARQEFEDARREHRAGELDDAANDAGCAVESTMSALLAAHGHKQPTKHGKARIQAGPLFDALDAVGLLDRERDRHLVFAPIDVRDAGSHGAGVGTPRRDPRYVEAGIAAAAVAITYLASKLP